MHLSITGTWNLIGEVFYKKVDISQMIWKIDLTDCTIIPAPFGGPIALLRSEQRQPKSILSFFTALGEFREQVTIDGIPAGYGWSRQEEFFCIHEKGFVDIYNVNGEPQQQIILDQEIRECKILQAQVFHGPFGTGLVILTQNYRFFVYNKVQELKVRRLSTQLSQQPICWSVAANEHDTKILVSIPTPEVLLIRSQDNSCQTINLFNDQLPVKDRQTIKPEPIVKISVSFDGTHASLLSDTGKIIFASFNNTTLNVCSAFDTESKVLPEQIVWCENSAVAAQWQKFILVIDLEKNWLKYPLFTKIHMISEPDCIRMVSFSTQTLIKKVEDSTFEVFRIGSTSPGGQLLEAFELFEDRSYKADDYIGVIQKNKQMELAVRQCMDAAAHEFSPPVQKMLLRAAAFGKSFIEPSAENGLSSYLSTPSSLGTQPLSDLFVHTCRTLKVLNAIRQPTCGIPMTYTQYTISGDAVLIDRLISRRHFLLALKIAEHIKLSSLDGENKILTEWAFSKVNRCKTMEEEQCANDIAENLRMHPGVSFSEVANYAITNGRTRLAIKLLEFEEKPTSQVPLLLKLKQYNTALGRAIESGDINLIHVVIIRLKDLQSSSEFSMSIREFPIAYALYQKFLKQTDKEALNKILFQEDNHIAEGLSFFEQAICEDKTSVYGQKNRSSLVASACDTFRKSKNEFLTSTCEEYLRLLRFQLTICPPDLYGSSVHSTIRGLILAGEYKTADECRKDFKFPEKKYFFVKLNTLADKREWTEIEKMSKKSPIGYEPFVDACLAHREKYEAQKYLSKVRDENKIKYNVKLGNLEEASKLALERKDADALEYIANKCGPTNQILQNKIRAMISQLRS